MFFKKYFWIFLASYFFLRIFSYFFGPVTPLQTGSFLNTATAVGFLLATTYLIWKQNIWGWGLVALEIILGGAGGFLSIGPLSLRTSLLIVSLIIFLIQKNISRQLIITIKQDNLLSLSITALLFWGFFSAAHGLWLRHPWPLVFSDIIPYGFLLYYFPLREIISNERFKQITANGVIAGIIGNSLFILLTIVGFSGRWLALQGEYYHWFRDVALGKITLIGLDFYRIVLNEHLLLIPLLLFFIFKLITIQKNKKSDYFFLSLLLFILGLNLTRIYLLALAVGILCLFSRKNWRAWLKTLIITSFLFITIFSTTHLIASRGQSFGWEIFGLRLQSIARPQIEDSSLSRMILLPKIILEIKQKPIIGHGLASAIAIYSPVYKKEITTNQFDWGYLEILTEMGIIGLVIWGLWISSAFWRLSQWSNPLKYSFFSILMAFLVVNLTSPAIFHVLGIILIMGITARVKS